MLMDKGEPRYGGYTGLELRTAPVGGGEMESHAKRAAIVNAV